MGISKNYATPIAMDIMRAYRQGMRQGALVHGTLGFGVGITAGVLLTMYVSTKLEEQLNKEKTE